MTCTCTGIVNTIAIIIMHAVNQRQHIIILSYTCSVLTPDCHCWKDCMCRMMVSFQTTDSHIYCPEPRKPKTRTTDVKISKNTP